MFVLDFIAYFDDCIHTDAFDLVTRHIDEVIDRDINDKDSIDI